ncbi:histidine phosphatase family protein [Plantactinospora sp. KBS50]|uniref:histidine phosphatase family protein n=1 Tax=Plantactinospora sp. KBS50 TaxID=2024580 RepID=UPI000BAB1F17|nr:histidine phosphatase family protein [Plantactinospora sp. KBS50]ASW55073.1 histidine phosphatase family protein [Plantactinospora sp. KBS50]
MAEILLVRHGQTEWSAGGRHTSYTDVPLTPDGERQARDLRPALAGREFAAVFASPRRRARQTAELAGLVVTDLDEDLVEWDYGDYEGRTSAQIRTEAPDWNLWTDGCPGGESPGQVGARLDRVLGRAARALDDGDVVLVAHGHSLRVAAARWIGLGPGDGSRLRLDTGSRSALGYEHARPVILRWNTPTGG